MLDTESGKRRERNWRVPVGVTIDTSRLAPVGAWLIDAVLELDGEAGVDDL